MTTYRVRFETVAPSYLPMFCNADPAYYKNVTQTTPNSAIPDMYWHEVVGRETEDPWQQYYQLCAWDFMDTDFVRNIKLEQLKTEPEWTEVKTFGDIE